MKNILLVLFISVVVCFFSFSNNDKHDHIWIDVVSDTVNNFHSGFGFVHAVGIAYKKPPEWQEGSKVVCLLCKNVKSKVIHNIGFPESDGFGTSITNPYGGLIIDSTFIKLRDSLYNVNK